MANAKLAIIYALASGAAFGLAYGPPWLKRVIGVAGNFGSGFGGVSGTPDFNPGYFSSSGVSSIYRNNISPIARFFLQGVGTISKRDRHRKTKGPCDQAPGDNQYGKFFSKPNLARFQAIANQLNTNVDFVINHAANESRYGEQHSIDLHNQFGITQAGGNNIRFDSYEQGADFYVKLLKNTKANGAKTFDDYIEGLKQAKYNCGARACGGTDGYYERVKSVANDTQRHKQECLGGM